MKERSTIWFLSFVFGIPAIAFAFFVWYEKKLSSLPVLGGKNHRIEKFILTDQDNELFEFTEGKIIVACFFFTHCPTVCPSMIKNLSRIQHELKDVKQVEIISITVDPERDSSERLKTFCLSRKVDNGNWKFLTGDKKTIYALARNSFRVVATDGDGGPEDFIHSEKFVIVDKQGRIRGFYNGTSTKECAQLIDDIKKLKDEN